MLLPLLFTSAPLPAPLPAIVVVVIGVKPLAMRP